MTREELKERVLKHRMIRPTSSQSCKAARMKQAIKRYNYMDIAGIDPFIKPVWSNTEYLIVLSLLTMGAS